MLGEGPTEWCVAIAAEMTRGLFAQLPELAKRGEVFEEARASSEANVLAILEMLVRGGTEAPAELPAGALDFVRRSVRRGIPIETILHAYRLGHQFLLRELQETIATLVDSESLQAMQDALTVSFRYIDAGLEMLAQEYEAERERWAGTVSARRAETVNAILAGEHVDARNASAVLGYALDRTHVAAILWTATADAGDPLRQAAEELASQLSRQRPLLLPLDGAAFWMWAVRADPEGEVPELALDRDGVRAAVGEIGAGVAGFRHSHKTAAEVARVARMYGEQAPAVLGWDDVGLVALMTANPERARAFVQRELGGLAAPDAGNLRDTVRAFLAHRGSHAAAARELYVHRNTVAYRLAHAEELLGHPVAERELELRVALEIATLMGEAVLPGTVQ